MMVACTAAHRRGWWVGWLFACAVLSVGRPMASVGSLAVAPQLLLRHSRYGNQQKKQPSVHIHRHNNHDDDDEYDPSSIPIPCSSSSSGCFAYRTVSIQCVEELFQKDKLVSSSSLNTTRVPVAETNRSIPPSSPPPHAPFLLLSTVVQKLFFSTKENARTAVQLGEFIVLLVDGDDDDDDDYETIHCDSRSSSRSDTALSSSSSPSPWSRWLVNLEDCCCCSSPQDTRILWTVHPWTPVPRTARIARIARVEDSASLFLDSTPGRKSQTMVSTTTTHSSSRETANYHGCYPTRLTNFVQPPPNLFLEWPTTSVLYQDDDIAVIHPPLGVLAPKSTRYRSATHQHGSSSSSRDTLESVLPFLLYPPPPSSSSSLGDDDECGLPLVVTEMDRGTAGGLVLVAKSVRAKRHYSLYPAPKIKAPMRASYTGLVVLPLPPTEESDNLPSVHNRWTANAPSNSSSICWGSCEWRMLQSNRSLALVEMNLSSFSDSVGDGGFIVSTMPKPSTNEAAPSLQTSHTSVLDYMRQYIKNIVEASIVVAEESDDGGVEFAASSDDSSMPAPNYFLVSRNFLQFRYPVTDQLVELSAPLPDVFHTAMANDHWLRTNTNNNNIDNGNPWMERARKELGPLFVTNEGMPCTGEPALDPSKMIRPNQGDSEWVDDW